MAGATVDVSSTASAVESLVRVCVAGLFRPTPPFPCVRAAARRTLAARNAAARRSALTTPHVKAAATALGEGAKPSEGKSDGTPASSPSPGAAAASRPGALTLARLQEEKSALKKRLRQYDTAFEVKYGRKPEKADKEPIRHLYQRYHDLKKAIEAKEAAGGDGGPGDVSSVGSIASAGASVGDIVSPSTLKGLKREKRRLQVRLRDYEDKFMAEHGRKVKYHRDIAPVAAEYRRYKEIKNTLKIAR